MHIAHCTVYTAYYKQFKCFGIQNSEIVTESTETVKTNEHK